jgi:SAM-dependent methyltransferase
MTEPYWRSPYIDWHDDLPAGCALLVCHLRTARQQARVAAALEVLSLLSEHGAVALSSGPLAEDKGVFWVALPQAQLGAATRLLPRLGYTSAVDLAVPASSGARWRGVRYGLQPLYAEDADALRERAPDQREFLLPNADGQVTAVRGYRGDGTAFGKRGLPVYDARLLVNLVCTGEDDRFLDPFAGIGGVILEAKASGARAFSLDNDPVLRYGLAALGDGHCLADAQTLPFADSVFDALATEPPYDPGGERLIVTALREMVRVLKPGGRLAVLCAGWQVEPLRTEAQTLPLALFLESPINRKGLDVFVFAWRKM